jgi:uncharacterized membrane protein
MFFELLLIPLLVGPIFTVAGLIMFRFPPKEINGLYGYRTPASMKNQERWDFAQNLAAKEMMKLGGLLTCTACVGFIVKINEIWAVLTGLSFMLIAFVLLLIRVERAIKRKFEVH